ncbi:probable carbohydrate esterase At4g34215 [Mangifera indica]|uniref:probable carbohydrate esterase At4g34215 n=1 Tax=Mangifera indica TaxID=29780 RepID=UPI001CFC2FB6|nr:probable carbohydrate esterase At4g34215 [Mangifera indica]
MLSIFFFILLSHACSVKSQLPQNIFILAGQSNMAGRGGVINDTKTNTLIWDGVVPAQCQPNPSILRLNAKLTWVQAHEPLHADFDVAKTNGVGPGMPFANAILTKRQSFGVIGLVPCAIGGTNISEWRKGSFHYEQMVRRTRVALQSGGIIRALLWYQGESDTITLEDAESYKGRLEKFFMDLRSDLQDPMLPIIQVALASGEGTFVDIVREAQLGSDLPNVECVDAKGLPLEPDGLHLSTPSQVRLGEMLADAFPESILSPTKASGITGNAPTMFASYISYFLLIQLLISLSIILTLTINFP